VKHRAPGGNCADTLAEAFAAIEATLSHEEPLTERERDYLRRKLDAIRTTYRVFGQTLPSMSDDAKRLAVIRNAADKLLEALGYAQRPDIERATDPGGAISHDIPATIRHRLVGRAKASAKEIGGYRDFPPTPIPDPPPLMKDDGVAPQTSSEPVPDGDPNLDYHQDRKLDQAIEGVVWLATWADAAIAHLDGKKTEAEKERRRKKGSEAARRTPDQELDDVIFRLGHLYWNLSGKKPTTTRSNNDQSFLAFAVAAIEWIGAKKPLDQEAVIKRWSRANKSALLEQKPWLVKGGKPMKLLKKRGRPRKIIE